MTPKTVGEDGLALVENSEGCRLTAYQDSVGVWTIGWGHTGLDVTEGLTITKEQAEEFLRKDLAAAERAVNYYVVRTLTQHQFDALVDFVFNLGVGNFLHSSLLRFLNAGDLATADAEFIEWDKAGGKVLPGLTKRRAAEAALFLEA